MLKKGFPALFQFGSSRSEFATAFEHQQLGVVDVRASHPIHGLLLQAVENVFQRPAKKPLTGCVNPL